MDKHIQLVGILNLIYRGLLMLGGLVLLVLSARFSHFLRSLAWYNHYDRYDMPPEIVLDLATIILVGIGIAIVVVSLVGIAGAIGVLKRKEWGRIVLLVVSFFNLLHVPLGTALGVYTIWVLMKDETVRLFNPSRGGQINSPGPDRLIAGS